MRKSSKLLVSLLVAFIFTVGLSTPFAGMPGLGNILNPYDGIYETARLSVHPEKATIHSNQVSSEVKVLRDNYGVPHIFAKNDEDLFYALGYLHAQDRLFQMDMQRRMAEGKLAEILGEDYVEEDKEMKRLGLGRSAENIVNKVGENMKKLVEAYSAGVNKRIKEDKLPLEFKLLHYKPSKWTPEDTLAVSKLIAWGLSGSLASIERQELVEKLGAENVWNELFPENTPYSVPIHDPPYDYAHAENQKSNQNQSNGTKVKSSTTLSRDLNSFFTNNSQMASNNWVVDENNSKTGNPIVASDPHLSLPLPALWYQAYMNSEEGYNTTGVTIPGIPVILIGANHSIAWGMTNITADDTDFYTYKTSSDGSKYLYDNEWRKFQEDKVTIKVRNSKDVQMKIKRTVHGPDVEPGENITVMKWTGHESSSELKGMIQINKADNLEEFKQGVKLWHCPPQNIVFADKYGNIALYSAGWVPIREEGVSGSGIQNGSNSKYDWKGFIPFEELPHTVNPPDGHISSANQDPVGDNYPYFIGRIFDPGYRGRRIDNLLSSKKVHSINDFEEYQSDIFSEASKALIPILLDITQGENFNTLTEQSLDALKDWDYEMRENGSAPLIWTIWEMKLFHNIFDDEYKKANAQDLPLPRPILVEKFMKEEPNSIWFDNVYTSSKENRENITIKSLKETVTLLSKEIGNNIEEWKWGEVNKYYFDHLTGLEALSVGPRPAPGSRATLKVAPSEEVHPDLSEIIKEGDLEFRVEKGPSWRMIVSPGKVDNLYMGVYPGGQSGNPLSSHYTDKLEKYLDQEYSKLSLPSSSKNMSEDLVESKLIIKPKE